MHSITYVTGCSGAGKTTVHDHLIQRYVPAVFELDDVTDERHAPNAGHVPWLQWRAAEHLHQMVERADDDGETPAPEQHRIVTGIMMPFALIGEYVWMAAVEAGVQVRFVLLDRPWNHIEDTLAVRYDEWSAADMAEQIENNRRLQRALRNQVHALAGGTVVSTEDIDAVVSAVTRLHLA